MAKQETLRSLFIDELRDIYSAEQQLVKALPKLAKASTSKDLRAAFEDHLEETKGHALRIEQIFQELGEPVKSKMCKGIKGVIAEGGEVLQEDYEGPLMDAAIIASAQRAEHYEMAAYGCLRSWAALLGESEAESLLAKTLEEEKAADAKLSKLADAINPQAQSGEQGEVEEEEDEENSSDSVHGRARSVAARR
jgi:ferritin-like metal-binding protein YciE